MDTDTTAETHTSSRTVGIGGRLVNLVSYVLFAVGVYALYAFFALFIGTPTLGLVEALPTIAAPTESDAIINVTPLILGVVASAVAVRVR
jgi:hypothetical protein